MSKIAKPSWFKKLLSDESTLLGLRVSLSIALAFAITLSWGLEKSYWAIIAILSINISINLGDVIVRSWLRFSMTVVGFVSATIL
ncbi:hypothetical protein N8865_01680, partial [Francisellaceae bacterium]|nr:hypothetical protein [Francisellaceae bacterium]MDA7742302.1 hypothetical protein [Francisellaceae bacterium]